MAHLSHLLMFCFYFNNILQQNQFGGTANKQAFSTGKHHSHQNNYPEHLAKHITTPWQRPRSTLKIHYKTQLCPSNKSYSTSIVQRVVFESLQTPFITICKIFTIWAPRQRLFSTPQDRWELFFYSSLQPLHPLTHPDWRRPWFSENFHWHY